MTFPESRKAKGPWFWGGGPFQNGCNQLVSLWSKTGFNNNPSLLGFRFRSVLRY